MTKPKPIFIAADGTRRTITPVEAEAMATDAERQADPTNLRYATSEQQAEWLRVALQAAVDQVMASLPAFGQSIVDAAVGTAVTILRADAVVKSVERDAAGDILRVVERREPAA